VTTVLFVINLKLMSRFENLTIKSVITDELLNARILITGLPEYRRSPQISKKNYRRSRKNNVQY